LNKYLDENLNLLLYPIYNEEDRLFTNKFTCYNVYHRNINNTSDDSDILFTLLAIPNFISFDIGLALIAGGLGLILLIMLTAAYNKISDHYFKEGIFFNSSYI
jgi:hypothetical protein